MEVTLPGGLWEHGALHRTARFRPVAGHLEQALSELGVHRSTADYVTDTLTLAVAEIGGLPAQRRRVESLCMADRHYLMLRLAMMFEGDLMWLRAKCSQCDEMFDVDILRSRLPVNQAGDGFPFVSLDLSPGRFRLRLPNGGDQSRIADLSESEAVALLLRSCVISIDDHEPSEQELDTLSDAEVQAIESALEEVAPAVCTTLLSSCPECGFEQQIQLDPYAIQQTQKQGFYEQVHHLASHYHWSEAEILNLSRERRHMYLGLIEREPGLAE